MATLNINYSPLLRTANPAISYDLSEEHNKLIYSRIAQLSSVTFETKYRFSDKDPFSFARDSENSIFVLLSRKFYPLSYLSSKMKFRFALQVNHWDQLMIHRREIVDKNYPSTRAPTPIDTQEVRTLRKAQSIPQVIRFFGAYRHVSNHVLKNCLITEHCAGGDLFHFIFSHRAVGCPIANVDIMIESIFKGVLGLHEMNIFHRDLKTENIFLTSDGKIRIADFEYATDLNNPTILPSQATPKSVSPEFLKRNFSLPNDVWAIALVAYCLYSLREPLFAISFQDIKNNPHQHYFDSIRLFHEEHHLLHDTDGYLTLFAHMFHPNPEKRPTMKQIVEEARPTTLPPLEEILLAIQPPVEEPSSYCVLV